jgi:hypothetical protein
MINELVDLASRYGPGALAVAVLAFLLLRGEIEFRYPARRRRPWRLSNKN